MQFITVSLKMRSLITFLTLSIFFILNTSFVNADTPDRVFGDVQILATALHKSLPATAFVCSAISAALCASAVSITVQII